MWIPRGSKPLEIHIGFLCMPSQILNKQQVTHNSPILWRAPGIAIQDRRIRFKR